MRKKAIKTIIFDLDGTLFQTEGLAIPAFRDTMKRLREECLYTGPVPEDHVLLSMLGKTNVQIWNELLNNPEPAVMLKADDYMLEYEMSYLRHGHGIPYPGVRETLEDLRNNGYRLCIASNGGLGYVTGVAEYHFGGLFTDIYSAGGYKTASKVELVKLIVERYQDGEHVMVGDRSSDIEAGKKNGIITIGCIYGFGNQEEVEGSDYQITRFPELKKLFL